MLPDTAGSGRRPRAIIVVPGVRDSLTGKVNIGTVEKDPNFLSY